LLHAVTRLACSNFCPDTNYPDWKFSRLSSLPQARAQVVYQIRPRPLSSTSFPIHNSLIILRFNVLYSTLRTASLSIPYTLRDESTKEPLSTAEILQLVGFEILTAVVMKNFVVWDITPCSPLKVNRRFGWL
jgi:hypothetical protein